VAWLTITSGATGSGNGSVGYTVVANTSTGTRSATLTIAGKSVTVTQSGATCSYSIAPTSQSAPSDGGTGTVAVTASNGCNWTALSNAAWLSITGGGSGNGSGTVSYTVLANTTSSQRTGTLTVAGQTFTVTQAPTSSQSLTSSPSGDGGSSLTVLDPPADTTAPDRKKNTRCTYTVTPDATSVSTSGGTFAMSVTTENGCTWSASTGTQWVSILAGSSGNGSGSVAASASINSGSAARTGTLTVAGQIVTVAQSGSSCIYTLSSAAATVDAKANTGTINVTASSSCTWTASTAATWLTVNASATSFTFTTQANKTGASRTATVQVGGATFVLTQLAEGGLKAPSQPRIISGR